ncbi:MAG: WG repeat-containing protein [Elusimicrobia bacterium]|nr:WG repeat-containing protein [Elusimicrobiota bacterium]
MSKIAIVFIFLNYAQAALIPSCEKGKCGYIDDISGKKEIAFSYDAARPFSKDSAAVLKKGLWGLIDKKGKWIVKPKFLEIKECFEGICAARERKYWGYVDSKGKKLTDFEFENALAAREGYAPVKTKKGWAIINLITKDTINLAYEEIFPFSQGLARIKRNGKYGYINIKGEEVLPPVYEKAFDFNSGYATAMFDSDWGFISAENLAFKKKEFESIGPYSQGLAPAHYQIDGKLLCGYVDKDGMEKISFRYSMCSHFRGNMAAVLKDIKGKWGFIDQNGNQITPFKYDSIYGFYDGFYMAIENGKSFYITSSGKEYPYLEIK